MVNDYEIVFPSLNGGYKHKITDIQCLTERLNEIILGGGGDNGEGPSVDLSPYATVSWVEENFSENSHCHEKYACKNWVESGFSCKCHSHTEYSLESHNHDCYVTEDELSSCLANYSRVGHLHDDRYACKCHSHDIYVTEDELYNCLANYALTTWVENCFACKSHSHENYACKGWVETCFACKSHSHTEYSLKDHDHNGIYAPYEHAHDNYALKDHLHDCYVTGDELYKCLANYALNSHCHENYACKDWVKSCFACKSHNHDDIYIKQGDITINGCINLENYATKDWARGCFAPLKHNHDDIYALKEHDHDDRYIRSTGDSYSDDLANYAKKSDLGTTCSALQTWVTNCYLTKNDASATYLTINDASNTYQPKGSYATESWVAAQGYACKQWVENNYATTQWVHNQGYATEEWAKNCFAPVDHNHDDRYIRSTGNPDYDNLANYATKAELNTSYSNLSSWVTNDYLTKNDALATYQPKGNYATELWVSTDYLTKNDALATYQPKGNYATEEWARGCFAQLEHNHDDRYIRSTGNPDYDNLSIYATKAELNTSYSNLSSWVTNDYLTKTDASSTYAKKSDLGTTCLCLRNWVEGKNYLTETSLDSYATTEWVHDQGYAGCAWVTRNYSDIEHDHCGKYIPSTGNSAYDNLAIYAKKSDIEGFLTKDEADDLYAEIGTYLTKDEADESYAALNDYCSHMHDSYYAPLYRPPYETLPSQIPTYISIVNKVNYLICAVGKLNCYLSSLNNGDNQYKDKDCKLFYAFGCDYSCGGKSPLYNEIAQFNNWSSNDHMINVTPRAISEHENTVISE